jgi:hypothetical protein
VREGAITRLQVNHGRIQEGQASGQRQHAGPGAIFYARGLRHLCNFFEQGVGKGSGRYHDTIAVFPQVPEAQGLRRERHPGELPEHARSNA